MYRLFIDIPIDVATPEEAINIGQKIMHNILDDGKLITEISEFGIAQFNYRLGNDEDRQRSNYFLLDDRGHANNKKCSIDI